MRKSATVADLKNRRLVLFAAPPRVKANLLTYLRKFAWREGKTNPKEWILKYHFGNRARSELQRGFKDETYRPAVLAVETVEIAEIEEVIGQGEEKAGEAKPKRKEQTQKEKALSPTAQELMKRGITKSVAIDFAESFSEEYLKEKIEMHDAKKDEGELTQNAAGWLSEAIRKDFQFSSDEKRRLVQRREGQAQQEEQQALLEKAEEIQEQRFSEGLKTFPAPDEWVELEVQTMKQMSEMRRKAVGGVPLTEEEIAAFREQKKQQIPRTIEAKRAWLRRQSRKYDLDAIRRELKPE